MKKITFILFALFTCWQINAQVSSYAFAVSTEAYAQITGTTSTATGDDGTQTNIPIGFTFNYGGTNYSAFGISTNGIIRLGSNATDTAINSGWTNGLSNTAANRPLIAPLWDDNHLGSGTIRYAVTGSTPNQVLTINWHNTKIGGGGTNGGADVSTIIRLYETTNVIEIVYSTPFTTANTVSASVGLNDATSFLSVTPAATSTVSSATANNAINATVMANLAGKKLIFTPPVPCSGTPVAGTVAPATQTLLSGQASTALTVSGQTSGVSSLTYQWEQSTDGTNWVNAVGGTGATTLSYTPPVFGGSMIMYRLRITCTISTETSVSTVATLNPCGALSVPSLETFDVFLPSCWQRGDNGDLIAGPATFGTSNWVADAFGNVGAVNNSVKMNIDAAVDNEWIISPLYSIPANYELKYDAAATQWNGTGAPTTAWEADDFVQVLVSTGTTNWTVLYTYNTANANIPSNTGTPNIIDLDTYAGQTVRFAFRAVEGAANGAADIDFFIDNFQIRQTPPCVEPTTLTATSISSNGANLSWVDPSGIQFDYEYIVQLAGGGVPTVAGNIVDITTLPLTINTLNPNTNYEFWVRANCGVDGNSAWVGPVTFRTLCNAITTLPHTEGFDAVTLPSCWTTALITGVTNWAPDDTNDGVPSARTGARFAGKSWVGNDDALLISPVYNLAAYSTQQARLNVWIYRSANGLSTDRVTFHANTANNLTGATMLVDIPLPITAAPVVATAGWYNYVVNIPLSFNTVGNFYIIAQGRTTSSFSSYGIGFDDYVLELVPATAPSCASNVVATPNATCGNFTNSITWNASVGADGYYVTVGTTSGGTDIANALSVSATSYSFTGAIGTTYFYTIVPYNAIGSATGCTQQSFTTNANGCYCVSAPTSVDGTGITNVQLVATNFANTVSTAPVYNDHTATVVDMTQGINNNVQITFNVPSFGSNSYNYNTVIWIDANDNFTFESSEIVYTGLSATTAAPTLLNASFVMPAGISLGQHRMRIVATDDLQTPSNPCYSGTYGETADFTINIVAASCTPPSAQATIVPVCGTAQFTVDVNVTALGSGTPSISDGTTTWPVSAIGVVNVGPFASGSSVTLTLLHGSDATCNLPLGLFNYSCPPVNDECANATILTPGGVFGDNDIVGTNAAATSSTGAPAPGCASYLGGDVWYSAVVPASGSLTFELNTNVGGITDGAGAVYSGTCGSLVLLGCNDSASSDPNDQPLVTVTGRTPGEVLYFRVWEFGNNAFGTFLVSAYDASLSSGSFDNANFSAYPNPVKDVLNVSYSTEISSIRVINMIGQEVISKNINATSTQVDMSQLSAGTYIVNVTVGDKVKTLKVVKQ